MDDTPRRVDTSRRTKARTADEMTGRATDDAARPATEEIRGRESTLASGTEATPLDPDAERRAREIRQEIQETREELSETIDAIQDKLKPANVVSSATEKVKHATTERVRQMTRSAGYAASQYMPRGSREAAHGLMDSIRENPMPAALIGIGAAWWWMNSRAHDRDRSTYGVEYDPRSTRMGDRRPRGAYGDPLDDPYAAHYADEDDASMLDEVKDRFAGAADSAQHAASRARAYARDTTDRAARTGRRAQSELERMTRQNPLAVGAGALLLGAAIGLAVPETERENEWLGETRDTVLDKAQEAARTAASRAQEAASDLAGEAAKRIVGGGPA